MKEMVRCRTRHGGVVTAIAAAGVATARAVLLVVCATVLALDVVQDVTGRCLVKTRRRAAGRGMIGHSKLNVYSSISQSIQQQQQKRLFLELGSSLTVTLRSIQLLFFSFKSTLLLSYL